MESSSEELTVRACDPRIYAWCGLRPHIAVWSNQKRQRLSSVTTRLTDFLSLCATWSFSRNAASRRGQKDQVSSQAIYERARNENLDSYRMLYSQCMVPVHIQATIVAAVRTAGGRRGGPICTMQRHASTALVFPHSQRSLMRH